jgi:hypothetical protein
MDISDILIPLIYIFAPYNPSKLFKDIVNYCFESMIKGVFYEKASYYPSI